MTRMLHSAKFWTAMLDVAISLVTYFITKYAAPDAAKDVLMVIGAIQVPIGLVIAAWCAEDVAALKQPPTPPQES